MQEKATTGPNSKKTSTSGMMSTEIDAISICRIIRECGRSGVRKIRFKDLELEFSTSSEKLAELPKTKEPQGEDTILVSQNQNETESPNMILNSEDKEALREFDELQLAIDDPLAYERMQIDEDFESQRVRGFSERNNDRRSEQVVHGSRGL